MPDRTKDNVRRNDDRQRPMGDERQQDNERKTGGRDMENDTDQRRISQPNPGRGSIGRKKK